MGQRARSFDRFNCNRIQRKTTQARKNLLLESKGLGWGNRLVDFTQPQVFSLFMD